MKLKLGALSPVASAKGVQQRLQNLGFDCGPIDGIVGPRTRAAVRNFQAKFGLPPDGILGPQTRTLLKEKHGC
jgi:N-acetylmuramoyl-L-alanine amidase